MKLRKALSAFIAGALVLGTMAVSAFADRDFAGELEATKLDGSAGWAGGVWLVGSDSAVMNEPLTVEDLGKYDYFEISYTCDEWAPSLVSDQQAQLTFIYKFLVTEADDAAGVKQVSEAYLNDGWVPYGPTPAGDYEFGNTYRSFDYFAYNLESEGTIKVPTADIIAAINVDPSTLMYMRQFGIGCNTYDYDDEYDADYKVNVTSVKLIGGDAAAEAPADDTTVPADTTAPAAEKGSPDTGVEGVAAVAALAVISGAALVVARKRK